MPGLAADDIGVFAGLNGIRRQAAPGQQVVRGCNVVRAIGEAGQRGAACRKLF